MKKREFSGLQREAQVVGIKMPVSEREGGEVLVCEAKVVSSVWDLLKGHIGSSCEVGKYKGLNHWRVGNLGNLGSRCTCSRNRYGAGREQVGPRVELRGIQL